MRRALNGVLAAAVAVVATVAALDAFRGDEAGQPARPEPVVVPAEVRGELVWSDADCARHAVSLPGLARRDFYTRGCGVFTRRDNLGVKDGEVAWFAYPDPGGSTTLLDREGLDREVGSAFSVKAVAWLGGIEFAAVLEGPRALVTTWRGSSLTTSAAVEEGFFDVRTSPSWRWFAVRGREHVRVYQRDGTPVDVGQGHSLAWSPDERWLAVARDGEVAVLPADGGEEVARLPVDAVDLDWRAAG